MKRDGLIPVPGNGCVYLIAGVLIVAMMVTAAILALHAAHT